ncbi:helix-turn-helix transcriptional regulator [Antrihabitans stalactiti]|uniref:DNA-binding protein n=1 Tax=Antrihabitans stalactiti TaxID=2584121 RepID=A0A848KAW0_9NOCA|nr:DNA-binding protein [Antrihabitans stalactiti]NMN94826.1 DNA-binding protein [Antrihabitans stalactiti]
MSNPNDLLSAVELEAETGTSESTWRYWASINFGPPSFKIGRRRVWRRSTVVAWIAEQERLASPVAVVGAVQPRSGTR